MILRTRNHFSIYAGLVFISVIFISLNAQAQHKNVAADIFSPLNKILSSSDSLKQHAVLSKLRLTSTASRQSNSLAGCNTSTFYMHFTADGGKKIELKQILTLPDGNYLLAGNVTLLNNEQEGLLCTISNSGAMLFQKQIRINNRPTTIFSIKINNNGQVMIAGIVHDVTDRVFVSLLNNDLSVNWLQVIDVASSPTKVVVDATSNNQVYFAAQLEGSVYYSILNNTGLTVWSKEVNIAGLDDLAGISHSEFSSVGMEINCIIGGKKMVQSITVDDKTGNILSSHMLGDGSTEYQTGNVSSYYSRSISTGIIKNNQAQFQLERHIISTSSKIETEHIYSIPLAVDFNTTSALDYAGDALGYCLPQQGKLVYIRHFASYQSTPEYTRQYDVPVGSSIAGITRSLNDGGYLFGLNTTASNEFILIKTDSIGRLAGWSYGDVANNFTETFQMNAAITSTYKNPGVSTEAAIMQSEAAVISSLSDCNQPYCPSPPQDDTCFSSYFKTFRSNSYEDGFSSYNLMRNNRHLLVTNRMDRIWGDQNQVTYGVKLLDEKGNFIKGINIFSNGISTPVSSTPVDDQHVLLAYISSINEIPCYTFTLIDDDLQILWTKSIQTYAGYNFGGSGASINITTDKEGNFYLVSNTVSFFENSKVLAYKMDANGDPVWLKMYELQVHGLFSIGATTTNTSLVILLDGTMEGSVSVRLDKITGNMLNAYNYQHNATNINSGVVKFDNDRIFYAGSTNGSKFAMGIFDITGMPLKIKSFDSEVSVPRSANVKSGKLYAMFNYFDGKALKDVLLKADTALSLEFANQFDFIRPGYPVGMNINDNGIIYAAGNWYYGGVNYNYADATLRKFDANGLMGTCTQATLVPIITDINLQTKAIGFSTINPGNFTPINIPVSFVPDTYGQQIAELLCSSTPNCNNIKVAGPVSICKVNETFTYHADRNSGCTVKPLWVYDTAIIILQSSNDSIAEIKFKKTGSTWLKVKLNAGCLSYSDSLLIQVQNAPSVFNLGKDTFLCKGNSILLNAGSGFNSYQWQDGTSDSTLKVTKPGQYYVNVDNVCGDIYKDSINILPVNIPVLNIGKDTTVCFGDTIHLIASNEFSKYSWQSANGIIGRGLQLTIAPVKNEFITLTASTIEGCKTYDTLNITSIKARPVFLGIDTSFCMGDSLMLFSGTGYLQYIWNNGSTTNSITVKQAGNYSVVVKDTNGCTAKDTLIIQKVYALPQPSLGNDFNLCKEQQRQIDAGNFNQYLWQDGTKNRYYSVSKPGTYWVKVVDVHSCSNSDTITLKSILPLPANFLNAVDSICQYEKLNIGSLDNFSSYYWSTGSVQRIITVDAPGTYTLNVQDSSGCAGTESIRIVQKYCSSGVYIPTAFSPNNDGLNDIFKVTIFGSIVSYRLEIYNRFGQIIFSSTDPRKGWDGYIKGVVQPNSAFVWQCFYQLTGKNATFQKGSVVLVR